MTPVTSGTAYRVESPPRYALVTPSLAAELHRVLERFAREAGFHGGRPVGVFFRPGVVGQHRVGRAADIHAVGGIGIARWKALWDNAQSRAEHAATPGQRRALLNLERRANLGWCLYKALQRYGRWSRPPGYPVQLFGPWTRGEGPWKAISDRLLHAHRDHIHVAR